MTMDTTEKPTKTCNSCKTDVTVDVTVDLIVRSRNHEGTAGVKHRAVFCLLCWHEELEPKLELLHHYEFAGTPATPN